MPVDEAGVSSSISFLSWPNFFNTKKTQSINCDVFGSYNTF